MTFVLVHGAFHGAWCWELVVKELEARGHEAIAVDLPAEEPSAGAARCAEVVAAAAGGAADPVVVGHSMGGVVIPVVATMMPVARLVFVAGLVPRPGMAMNDIRAAEPVDAPTDLENPEFEHLGDGVWRVGPNTARRLFYHDVPDDLAAWAIARLRPQAYLTLRETTPLESWPDTPADYIVCRDDRAVNAEWGRMVARDQLGTIAREIDGGHSPFLTRPAELAEMLVAPA